MYIIEEALEEDGESIERKGWGEERTHGWRSRRTAGSGHFLLSSLAAAVAGTKRDDRTFAGVCARVIVVRKYSQPLVLSRTRQSSYKTSSRIARSYSPSDRYPLALSRNRNFIVSSRRHRAPRSDELRNPLHTAVVAAFASLSLSLPVYRDRRCSSSGHELYIRSNVVFGFYLFSRERGLSESGGVAVL